MPIIAKNVSEITTKKVLGHEVGFMSFYVKEGNIIRK